MVWTGRKTKEKQKPERKKQKTAAYPSGGVFGRRVRHESAIVSGGKKAEVPVLLLWNILASLARGAVSGHQLSAVKISCLGGLSVTPPSLLAAHCIHLQIRW